MNFKEYFKINQYACPICKQALKEGSFFWCGNKKHPFEHSCLYYQNINIIHLYIKPKQECRIYQDEDLFKAKILKNNKLLIQLNNQSMEEIIKLFIKIPNMKTFL